MATLATVGNLLFGVAAAVFITKGKLPGRGIVRLLSILPFAIPGTVIAINLIVTFSNAHPLAGGAILVGSFWLLPLAYFIRHIPLIVRSTISSLESYDDRLTDASQDLGAGSFRTFWSIVLPSILPGVLARSRAEFRAATVEFGNGF